MAPAASTAAAGAPTITLDADDKLRLFSPITEAALRTFDTLD